MQTVKAIIINSCSMVDYHYLEGVILDQKQRYCNANHLNIDNLDSIQKRKLSSKFDIKQLNSRLTVMIALNRYHSYHLNRYHL